MTEEDTYKYLLGAISEIENQRRIQESKIFEEEEKNSRMKELITLEKENCEKIKEREKIIQEETSRELEKGNDLEKQNQQIKTTIISQQQSNNIFDSHVKESLKRYSERRDTLEKELQIIKERYKESMQIWMKNDNVQILKNLQIEAQDYRKRLETFLDEDILRVEVKSLEREIRAIETLLERESISAGKFEYKSTEDEDEEDLEDLEIEYHFESMAPEDYTEEILGLDEFVEALEYIESHELCFDCVREIHEEQISRDHMEDEEPQIIEEENGIQGERMEIYSENIQ